MKLFGYLFFLILLGGGVYLLFFHDISPDKPPEVVAWEAEAQSEMATLVADQLKASQTNDWSSFETDVKKAQDHLAKAPEGADTRVFKEAIGTYAAQVQRKNTMESLMQN